MFPDTDCYRNGQLYRARQRGSGWHTHLFTFDVKPDTCNKFCLTIVRFASYAHILFITIFFYLSFVVLMSTSSDWNCELHWQFTQMVSICEVEPKHKTHERLNKLNSWPSKLRWKKKSSEFLKIAGRLRMLYFHYDNERNSQLPAILHNICWYIFFPFLTNFGRGIFMAICLLGI